MKLPKAFGMVEDVLFSKEIMVEAAVGAAFMQNFKLAVWKRMTNWDGSIKGEFDYIPEKTLDELAMIAEDCLIVKK